MSRRHRLHLPDLQQQAPGDARVVGPEAHHLARVLRARMGDAVQAFDGHGRQADGTITAVTAAGDMVEVRLTAPRPSDREPPLELVLAVPLLKGDKLASVVRQGTELGVARFALTSSARSEVPRLSPAKAERLRRIAAEAAKQCGRATVPTVHDPQPLAKLRWSGVAWIADPTAPQPLVEACHADLPPGQLPDALWILTGPEGGFDPAERQATVERGARPIALAARVLRAETAPIAVAAVATAWAER